MIVPRTRLLFSVAIVILPLALLAAAKPEALPICGLVAGILGAIVIADAAASGKCVAGIDMELPAIVRMSKDREARIPVRVQNKAGNQRLLRIALGLPHDIEAAFPERDVLLAAETPWSRFEWV